MASNWAYGDSIKDYIILFVVLDPLVLQKYCDTTGKENTKDIVDDDDLRQAVYDDIISLANESGLNSLEKPKQIHLVYEPWTDTMGILTPTSKLKRSAAKTIYQAEIDKLYAAPIMKAT